MNRITIKHLPSGWWAVFVDGVFIEAALKSEHEAKECAEKIKKYFPEQVQKTQSRCYR